MGHCEDAFSRLRAKLGHWRKSRRGTVAIVYSLVIVPVVAIFGLAVNYSQVNGQRESYQRIADAAALAGATASASDSDSARQARAIQWFNTQIAEQKLPPATATATVTNGMVVVNASATFTPNFKGLYQSDWTVKVSSTAQLATVVVRRALEVIFCIDATGSMQNTINAVKAKANSFSDDLNTALVARGYEKFDYTRIRAVFYRDFYADDGKLTYYWGWGWYQNPIPMSSSSFFEMPSQKNALSSFLGTQNADGGGDLPESGYECVNEGMSSVWKKVGDPIPNTAYKIDQVYPVIILWTDADARTMPDTLAQAKPLYPANMPRTQAAFTAKWGDANTIDQTNKMLAIFGPCSKSSWAVARGLSGYMCAGTLNDGNTNMVNKIADAMAVRYKNLNARLTK
jgi:Flp pilus assembly protein TadG